MDSDCGASLCVRNCSRSGERVREHREHAEVGMERDPLASAQSERREAVLVLEPSEGALNGGTATVEVAPALRLRAFGATAR